MNLLGFSILCIGLLSSGLSSATSFEYIPTATREKLAQEFATGKAPTQDVFNRTWVCEMYGMRSHIQIKKNVSLYQFLEPESKLGEAKNLGSHPIKIYTYGENELVGKTTTLIDKLRQTKAGQIIAELTSQKDDGGLIAYSRCK